jgi:pilus assembly protein Flp/PilA
MKTMMQKIIARVRKLVKNEEGVTAMEYGLIAAATVVAISAFMPGITTRLSGIFSGVSNAL